MKTKSYIIIIGSILVVSLFFIFNSSASSNFYEVNNFDGEMIVYKDSSCGCCDIYGNYFKSKGNSNVEILNVGDLNSIKDKYKIPQELRTCHTVIVGDYFVEGHVPLEAIEKLLKEKPAIAGIAMPGMPSGSPGMPGNKYGDFIIYAVSYDGTYQEFMRI